MTHIARKRFGQNFLHDSRIINQIIGSLNVKADQHWIEIGPGQGALTEPLLKQNVHLDVVELDRDLVQLLQTKLKNYPNLTIHSTDALRFDFSSVASEKKLHIVGNLPYNISTPLMFHLLEYAPYISDMYFMLQKEVVDRICAEPNNKQYGKLSIMMQYYCQTEHLFDVPPESFDPIPKVTSAIVRLTPHSTPIVDVHNVKQLRQLVTHAFSQRRKTLRNSLKKHLDEQIIIDLGINPNLRAENISLFEFAKLSNALTTELKDPE